MNTTYGQPLPLDHLLELAHALGSQAEPGAATAERNRRVDEIAVRALIVLCPRYRLGGTDPSTSLKFAGFSAEVLQSPASTRG